MLPHIPYTWPRTLIMGNRSSSVMTLFVLTQSGSCQSRAMARGPPRGPVTGLSSAEKCASLTKRNYACDMRDQDSKLEKSGASLTGRTGCAEGVRLQLCIARKTNDPTMRCCSRENSLTTARVIVHHSS